MRRDWCEMLVTRLLSLTLMLGLCALPALAGGSESEVEEIREIAVTCAVRQLETINPSEQCGAPRSATPLIRAKSDAQLIPVVHTRRDRRNGAGFVLRC